MESIQLTTERGASHDAVFLGIFTPICVLLLFGVVAWCVCKRRGVRMIDCIEMAVYRNRDHDISPPPPFRPPPPRLSLELFESESEDSTTEQDTTVCNRSPLPPENSDTDSDQTTTVCNRSQTLPENSDTGSDQTTTVCNRSQTLPENSDTGSDQTTTTVCNRSPTPPENSDTSLVNSSNISSPVCFSTPLPSDESGRFRRSLSSISLPDPPLEPQVFAQRRLRSGNEF